MDRNQRSENPDIDGVVLDRFVVHRDDRGWLAEVFHDGPGFRPLQWNATHTVANSLRGVHVHREHTDMLVVLQGRLAVGLHDLRRGSPTHGRSCMVAMSGEHPGSLLIPTGVAHGWYAPEAATYVYAFDRHFDPSDELGCHWADPELGLAWPCREPLLSDRDRAGGTLRELAALYER